MRAIEQTHVVRSAQMEIEKHISEVEEPVELPVDDRGFYKPGLNTVRDPHVALSPLVFQELRVAAQRICSRTEKIGINQHTQYMLFRVFLDLVKAGRSEDVRRTVYRATTIVFGYCIKRQSYVEGASRLLELASFQARFIDECFTETDLVGILTPGWFHQEPADTTGLKEGDHVCLVAGWESLSTDKPEVGEERVWAVVDFVNGDELCVRLLEEDVQVGPLTTKQILHSDRHTYISGRALRVPRHAIFEVSRAS